MIVQNQTITEIWTWQRKDYYLSLGYEDRPFFSKFEIPVSDLHPKSSKKVKYICDNCGDINERFYNCLLKQDKHFCNKPECVAERIRRSTQKTYGVNNVSLIPEIKERQIETFKSHYGKIENPDGNAELSKRKNETHMKKTGYASVSADPEIQKVRADTYESKTGYRNPFSNPEIVAEIQHKNLLRYKENNQIPTSAYQKHLHEILDNSTLNYVVGNVAIDIAYPNECIGIEYNGAGHFYSVLIKAMTIEDAKRRDIKRGYFLHSLGWKLIHVDNFTKKKPYEDTVMINLIALSKQHLIAADRSWVRIDVDNNAIYGSDFLVHLDSKGKLL